ncbi:MAG: KTSC domain-containing protein [Sphingomicrobium sp.]
MRLTAMPSSVIRRFVYDETEANLWVEFTTGRRYIYFGVPQEVADAFRGAFAKGVYFNTRIRDGFPFREVVHEAEETQS